MDRLNIINILDKLDGCPSDGMDWILDGLLTTLTLSEEAERYAYTRLQNELRSKMEHSLPSIFHMEQSFSSEGRQWRTAPTNTAIVASQSIPFVMTFKD